MVWVVSSAVEHYLDTVGVTSSILVPPTIFKCFQKSEHFSDILITSHWRYEDNAYSKEIREAYSPPDYSK